LAQTTKYFLKHVNIRKDIFNDNEKLIFVAKLFVELIIIKMIVTILAGDEKANGVLSFLIAQRIYKYIDKFIIDI